MRCEIPPEPDWAEIAKDMLIPADATLHTAFSVELNCWVVEWRQNGKSQIALCS